MRVLLLIASFLLVVASLAGQRQFQEAGKLYLPFGSTSGLSVALGDVDGDGDVDFFARESTDLGLYLNDGTGAFRAGKRIPHGGTPRLVDVDMDGDLDLFLSLKLLFFNDGKGNFRSYTSPVPGISPNVAFGDVDGDGDPDLVVNGGKWSGTRLWINIGSGLFLDDSSFRIPKLPIQSSGFAIVDIDSDGDNDIVAANYPYSIGQQRVPGPTVLYLNNGRGYFSYAPGRLPYDPWDDGWRVLAEDFDGDKDVDLLIANYSQQNRLYLNDGKATFTDVTGSRLPKVSRDMAAVDVDGDGDVDLIGRGPHVSVFLNDGNARFHEVPNVPPGIVASWSNIGVADVDGDKAPDLVFARGFQHLLLLNDGRGRFADATSWPFAVYPHMPVVAGDVDGDGAPDLAVGRAYGNNRLFRMPGAMLFMGDGSGNFRDESVKRLPDETAEVERPMFLVDVDGDRDMDLLFFGFTGPPAGERLIKLYANDGSGAFTDVTSGRLPVTARLLKDRSGIFTVGDVDSDGDPDLVLGIARFPSRLFVNDGKGSFTEARGRLPAMTKNTVALLLADIDRDGDQDLFVGVQESPRSQTMVWRNDGKGSFTDVTASQFPITDDLASSLAFGDVDRDGDGDIVVGNCRSQASRKQRHRLYLNDGKGGFRDVTTSILPNVESDGGTVSLSDLDHDGHLDILASTRSRTVALWKRDRFGFFRDASSRLPLTFDEYDRFHVLADVDLDGDQDLITSGRLFLNLHRQAHAPFLARLGRDYVLDVYSRPGYAPAGQFALPFIASRPARIPVPPYGLLGLHPGSLLSLPLMSITQGTGRGRTVIPVPRAISLLKQKVFMQSLLIPTLARSTWRFTNTTLDILGSH